uniref:Uncharacterized protein n=1 Tax=Ditylenchus dipsaci TaxID=166011 RepID=A0A915DC27_9BILA
MDVATTRNLFSTLIQKPVLTDQLLQRPPFKFLHDIVTETVRCTGYPDVFSADELDATKTSASRDSKLAFLQRLVDVLNIDGSLEDVKPAKIIAGKEPELTNLLLQKLASDALVHLASKSSKKKSSSSSKKSSKVSESPKKSSKDASSKEKKISKAAPESKEEPSKSKTPKDESSRSKSKVREHKSSKEKEKKSSSSIASEDHNANGLRDEGIGSPHVISHSTAMLESSRASLPDRESSGGTSKGEDSGIADETGAESERRDSARRALSNQNPEDKPQFFDIPASTSIIQEAQPVTPVPRPLTSAGRPQTSVARPGTAVTRAPPPKLKKTKVAEIDTTTVSAQPASVGNLILEDDLADKKAEVDEFLVEEDEEAAAFVSSDASGARIASMDKDSVGHGLLVNKIIENTRELEKEALSTGVGAENVDMHESRRIRLEIESVQKAIQSTTQSVQPLTRTLEHITDDFDSMLKEIEDSRKLTARTEQLLQEQRSASVNENTFALSSTLRNLDAEIKDIRLQISSAETGSVIPAQLMSTANIRLWQHVVDSLQTSNLFLILKYLINEHREKKETAVGLRNHFSIYRDILFVALDRFNRSVDREQFDRQYAQELEHLPPRIRSLLSAHDYAPKPVVIACRRIWLPLDIL